MLAQSTINNSTAHATCDESDDSTPCNGYMYGCVLCGGGDDGVAGRGVNNISADASATGKLNGGALHSRMGVCVS